MRHSKLSFPGLFALPSMTNICCRHRTTFCFPECLAPACLWALLTLFLQPADPSPSFHFEVSSGRFDDPRSVNHCLLECFTVLTWPPLHQNCRSLPVQFLDKCEPLTMCFYSTYYLLNSQYVCRISELKEDWQCKTLYVSEFQTVVWKFGGGMEPSSVKHVYWAVLELELSPSKPV